MKSTAFKALSIKANVNVTPLETKFANQTPTYKDVKNLEIS